MVILIVEGYSRVDNVQSTHGYCTGIEYCHCLGI